MEMETGSLDEQLPLHGVGDKLRIARKEAGLTLEQLAAETRIPQRHLEVIETGDWNALPARTYATGFARTYAKAVGLDPRQTVDEVRAELAASEPGDRPRGVGFEPGDPARVPSRGLALFSLFAVIVLLAGGFMFYTRVLAPGAGPGSLLVEQRAAEARARAQNAAATTATPQAVPTDGPVVFTALEDGMWIKFYDAGGNQLLQKEMAKGESYTIPQDADGPLAWTGRPDAFAITVGGQPVAKLAEEQTVVRDVPVSAEALLARSNPQATSTGSARTQTVSTVTATAAARSPSTPRSTTSAAPKPAPKPQPKPRRTATPKPKPSATPSAPATVSRPVVQALPTSGE